MMAYNKFNPETDIDPMYRYGRNVVNIPGAGEIVYGSGYDNYVAQGGTPANYGVTGLANTEADNAFGIAPTRINDKGDLVNSQTGQVIRGGIATPAPAVAQPSNILQQLRSAVTGTQNPAATPAYQIYNDLATSMGDQAARQIMEILNSRGILRSTITRDEVATAVANARLGVMPNILSAATQQQQNSMDNMFRLYGIEYQQQQAQLAQEERNKQYALDRWRAAGVADNQTAISLGVSPGTLYSDALQKQLDREAQAKRDELDRQTEMRLASMTNARMTQLSPKEIAVNNIWSKFNNGQTLTDDEKQLIGLKSTATIDYVALALKYLASDPGYQAASNEERERMITEMVAILQRAYGAAEGVTGNAGTLTDEQILQGLR